MDKKSATTRREKPRGDEFYEVLPYIGAIPYRDDRSLSEEEAADQEREQLEHSAKMMAIVTLAILAVIVAAMSYVVVRGYQTVRDSNGTAQTSLRY